MTTDIQTHAECGTCRANRGELRAPGGVIYEDGLWRLEHLLEPVPFAGWLVLKQLRHIESLAEMNPDEGAVSLTRQTKKERPARLSFSTFPHSRFFRR